MHDAVALRERSHQRLVAEVALDRALHDGGPEQIRAARLRLLRATAELLNANERTTTEVLRHGELTR